MNVYESIVIFNASLSDEEIESAAQKVKDLISGSGGEILKAEAWGRKKLAYQINKQSRGFYLLLLFRSTPSLIKKMEDYFRVFDPVVKYMVIRLEKKQLQAALKSVAVESASPKAETAQTSETAAAPKAEPAPKAD